MVRRGSVMVRRGSVIVRCGSVGSTSACCKAGPRLILREVFPTEHTSDEDMERGFSEWRRMNVLWLNDCMYVIKSKINKKSGILPGCHQPFRKWLSQYRYDLRVCTPPPLVRGEDTLAGWKGGGGSIFWKTPDTALYSTYVSTLWPWVYLEYTLSQYLWLSWNCQEFLKWETESWRRLTFSIFGSLEIYFLCEIGKN